MAAAARPRPASLVPAALAGARVAKAQRRAQPSTQSGADAMAAPVQRSWSRRALAQARCRRGPDRGRPRAWLRFALKRNGVGRSSRGNRPETGRQRQPQTKARTSRAIGPIEHFDSAAVRKSVLARDRHAHARPFDPASGRNLALVERLEYSRPLVRIDARTLIADIQHGKIAFNRKVGPDRR